MQISFNRKRKIWLSVVLALAVVVVITLVLISALGGFGGSRAHLLGAVVSNGKDCAKIGSDILDEGGSAADAAIATMLCEGILLPQSMGLGGGFVATIYNKADRKIETIIARERAPAAASKDMFVGKEIKGAISGAVPGEILGYAELHKRRGRLPWKRLFEPAIKMCKEGHLVSAFLARVLKQTEATIRNESSMAEIFVKPDGSLYQENDILKRPVLGETLEIIANEGADAMYGKDGKIGRLFAEDIQAMGGIITAQDMANYKVRWEDTNYIVANVTKDYTLYSTPLPSSGALLTFILNIMTDFYTDNREIYMQRIVEAFKHAYGQRTNLGDMENELEMADVIKQTMERLKSREFAASVRKLIHDNQTFTDYKYYGANFSLSEDHGTANMAVLAPNGDAVVITSTVNNYLGAKVRSKRTGIILNDEMDDFSTPGTVNGFGVPASRANYIQPGKMPFSSMCPSIILDNEGNVRMLIGAAGGTRITTAVAMSIIKYLIIRESMEEAINTPRLHHQLAPMHIEYEPYMSPSLITFFKNVGHEVMESNTRGFAAVTAIGVRDNTPDPVFDKRRVGSIALVQAKNKMQH